MNLPDFDHLRQLAERQPEALESLRTKLISKLINGANDETKQRLRGLQFQIDAQRQLHKNPLGACIKISTMMTNSFHEMIAQLNQSDAGNKPTPTAKLYKLEMADSDQ